MNTELLASLLVPVAYAAMWFIEARSPARPYVEVKGWKRLGAVFFVIVAVIGSITPLLWAAVGLTSLRLFDLSSLEWWGYPLGLLLTSGVTYAWHRAVHRVHFLWLATHQLHHSAERIDVPGAFFTHPLEVVFKTTLGLLVSVVLLGLAPPVAAMVSSTLALLSIFAHWNVHTPRWLGFFVPRPESHALHHERGVHGRNYGDLPLWDMIFGTFENPGHFEGAVGLDVRARDRLLDMLAMRDVHAENPSEQPSVASLARRDGR